MTSPAKPRATSSRLLALLRVPAILVTSAFVITLVILQRLLARDRQGKLRVSAGWTGRWGRWCTRLAGYHVRISGPTPPPGSLLAPNHLGYPDIIVVASAVPTFFVPKAELGSWPFFGFLMRQSDHVFVSRRRAKDLRDSAGGISERLQAGFRVCVFLEGTSSGGGEILRFGPSFLQPAIDAGAPVVPVFQRWLPADPAVDVAEDIAYWKDHVFFPHLCRHLGLRGLTVEVHFGEPIPSAGRDRKELARQVREAVLCLREEAEGRPPGLSLR